MRSSKLAWLWRSLAIATPGLIVAGLASCQRPSDLAAYSIHPPSWMNPASSGFHGTVVAQSGYDYSKAKFEGVTCSTCHAGKSPTQVSPLKAAPNCFSCHGGGPDGSAGHPVWWADPTHLGYHGAAVIAAGYDYTRAIPPGNALTCSDCHAGVSPAQPSVNPNAPNCFTCHGGGPDGSAGHPPGWAVPTAPVFHGAFVVEAGWDYTKAVPPGSLITCSGCHGGMSPTEPGLNSRAPNCFACHIGGPDGGAGHPPGWVTIPDYGEIASPIPTPSAPVISAYRLIAPTQVYVGDTVVLKMEKVMSDGSTESLPGTAEVDFVGPQTVAATDNDTLPPANAATLLATDSTPTGFFVVNPVRYDHSADLKHKLFTNGLVTGNGSDTVSAAISGLGLQDGVSSPLTISIGPLPPGNTANGQAQYAANCAQCHGTTGQGCTIQSIFDNSPAITDVGVPGLDATSPGGSPNLAADPGWNAALLAFASRADVDNSGIILNLPMPNWLSMPAADGHYLTMQDFADIYAWLLTQTTGVGGCPIPQ